MSARVTTTGTVQATASTTDTTAGGDADSGAWAAGTVQEMTFANLTAGGDVVVHEATCTFTFSGSKGQSQVTKTSDLKLSASATLVQRDTSGVLVAGDKATDSFGNTLEAKPSAGKLFSAKS